VVINVQPQNEAVVINVQPIEKITESRKPLTLRQQIESLAEHTSLDSANYSKMIMEQLEISKIGLQDSINNAADDVAESVNDYTIETMKMYQTNLTNRQQEETNNTLKHLNESTNLASAAVLENHKNINNGELDDFVKSITASVNSASDELLKTLLNI